MRIINLICKFTFLVVMIWSGGLLADKVSLRQDVLCMQMVVEEEVCVNQSLYKAIHDIAAEHIETNMKNFVNHAERWQCLQNISGEICDAVRNELRKHGITKCVIVRPKILELQTDTWESVQLPEGTYETLQIQIGELAMYKENSIAYPPVYVQATGDVFVEETAFTGLSDSLSDTILRPDQNNIRFELLSWLGKIEILLF